MDDDFLEGSGISSCIARNFDTEGLGFLRNRIVDDLEWDRVGAVILGRRDPIDRE
jgi:hypothetical protein